MPWDEIYIITIFFVRIEFMDFVQTRCSPKVQCQIFFQAKLTCKLKVQSHARNITLVPNTYELFGFCLLCLLSLPSVTHLAPPPRLNASSLLLLPPPLVAAAACLPASPPNPYSCPATLTSILSKCLCPNQWHISCCLPSPSGFCCLLFPSYSGSNHLRHPCSNQASSSSTTIATATNYYCPETSTNVSSCCFCIGYVT